jgi:hypothetical protein
MTTSALTAAGAKDREHLYLKFRKRRVAERS